MGKLCQVRLVVGLDLARAHAQGHALARSVPFASSSKWSMPPRPSAPPPSWRRVRIVLSYAAAAFWRGLCPSRCSSRQKASLSVCLEDGWTFQFEQTTLRLNGT